MVRLRHRAGLALIAGAAAFVGSTAACDDIRLPAIVVDGGTAGAGGDDGSTGTSTHTSTCPDDKERCGEICIDPRIDNQHCGGCDHPCTGGASCVLGDCLCPAGEQRCEDRCVHLDADPDHCGECGHPCKSGICVAGECE